MTLDLSSPSPLPGRPGEARHRSAALRSTSQMSVARADGLCRDAHRLVAAARSLRTDKPDVRSTHRGWFRILGLVDDEPVTAVWKDGALVADQAILERAKVVVALGDTWRRRGQVPPIRASLSGDQMTVLLTVLRALSRTDSVEFDPATVS